MKQKVLNLTLVMECLNLMVMKEFLASLQVSACMICRPLSLTSWNFWRAVRVQRNEKLKRVALGRYDERGSSALF